jgi:heme/copper-type cytochrome/quinol oxidase subunit 3
VSSRIARALAGGPERQGLSTAWWGMLMLAASEATLFGAAIAGYFYLRVQSPSWPPAGIPEPPLAVPLVLAFVLALASAPMWLASRAANGGRVRAAILALACAFVVQSGYLAYELHSYVGDLQRFGPGSHAYGSIYFLLLGADHAHVLVGLLLDLWLLAKLARGLTRYRGHAAQAIALYWYAVNGLTLVVIGTILPARL